VLIGIAWLPLVVLTLIDGTFITTDITMPFVKDVVPYVRGLIVIPLLVMADNVIEPMMIKTSSYLRESGIVSKPDLKHMENAVGTTVYLINTKWIQLLLAALAITVSWVLQADYVDMWTERNVTSWALHLEGDKVDETLAGMWFLLVTSPMLSFLLYRWIWRFIVWSIFLYRVSRLKLELYASHTDLAGGLAIIGYGQSLFVIIFIIMASLISSDLANNILYEGEKLVDVKLVVLVFIISSIIVIATPLFFFTSKLVSLKRKSLAQYGELQQQISRDFHQHWIDNKAKELVDSMQPSAMADYSAVYEIVANMRVVPLNPKAVIVLVAILLVPFLPLALTEQSIWDVLKMIGDSVL
jgi:ABC-type iron transport system FetAB permease component